MDRSALRLCRVLRLDGCVAAWCVLLRSPHWFVCVGVGVGVGVGCFPCRVPPGFVSVCVYFV